MKKLNKFALLLSLFSGAAAVAQSSSSAAEIKASDTDVGALSIGGRVWAQYYHELTEGAKRNGFDVTRALLQAQYKFDPTWSALVMIDHERTVVGQNKASSYTYVRNAYLQAKAWAGDGTFRFGVQPTPYVSLIDGVTKMRWIVKSLADDGGMLSSQEGGVSGTGWVGESLYYALMVHNGLEGLGERGANDNALAATAMLSFYPLKGRGGDFEKLGVTASSTLYGAADRSDGTREESRQIVTAALHMEHSLLDTALEYLFSKQEELKVHAYAITANVKLLEKYSLYGRYYFGNGEFKAQYGAKDFLSVGPTMFVYKKQIQTALIWERKRREAQADVQRFMWNWSAQF